MVSAPAERARRSRPCRRECRSSGSHPKWPWTRTILVPLFDSLELTREKLGHPERPPIIGAALHQVDPVSNLFDDNSNLADARLPWWVDRAIDGAVVSLEVDDSHLVPWIEGRGWHHGNNGSAPADRPVAAPTEDTTLNSS